MEVARSLKQGASSIDCPDWGLHELLQPGNTPHQAGHGDGPTSNDVSQKIQTAYCSCLAWSALQAIGDLNPVG